MNDHAPSRTTPDLLQRPLRMLIGEQWVEAASGEVLDVENPASGEVVAAAPRGAAADVDQAVQAARHSFDAGTWHRLSGVRRERIMLRLAELLEQHHQELVHLEVLDCGMPISLAGKAIERGVDGFRYYAGMCTKIYGVTSDISGPRADFHAYSRCEPAGVAALIIPWNSPLVAALNKLGPALAAGCSVILKPAEQTPLTALRLGELALEAGVPAGVVNIVTGLGNEAGAALSRHPDVDKLSFTGSTAVGKQLIRDSATNLKRLTLELGGKSPVFIFNDADMDKAIPRAANAIFANTGQICYAGSRLYIQKESFDRVVAGIADIARNMRIGDGFDPKTQMGPLISEQQQRRVLEYIDLGVAEGAELVEGGGRFGESGYFVSPTVFNTTGKTGRLTQEEIFGPVLAAMPFSGLEDLATLANDTDYGLGAGVFTRDVGNAHMAAKLIRTGNVWVNFYGGTDKSLPFGGYKQSGWGREGGQDGIDAFLEKKSVYIRL